MRTKHLILIGFIFILISCDKEYNCLCTSLNSASDTIVDKVKTTKLGAKGYSQTCTDKEKILKVSNCALK